MDYKNKYLKYKQKYIALKAQSNFVQSDSFKQKYIDLKNQSIFVQDDYFIGGQACKNLNDELKQILESPDSTCKKIENVKNVINIYSSTKNFEVVFIFI